MIVAIQMELFATAQAAVNSGAVPFLVISCFRLWGHRPPCPAHLSQAARLFPPLHSQEATVAVVHRRPQFQAALHQAVPLSRRQAAHRQAA